MPEIQNSADRSPLSYRADVDGLRAVAVLSVIAYHLHKPFLPGGFLGVDIFFVISGYLITSIIWREAVHGRFSIARFYYRRISRIIPALLNLLIFVTLVAILMLLPTDLLGYARSVLATLGFFANIYFWRDTNYFSRDAEEKPLLHLWSLGVEEQFYIAVPLLLVLLASRWRAGALPLMATMVALSLLLNMVALRLGGHAPAFFLLPTRAWELGAGAMLALLPTSAIAWPTSATAGGRFANAFGLAGAALVGLGLIAPTKTDIMPVALPVIMGTCLMIWSRGDVVVRLLSLRPVVFVGLISYSLYLWHWPILVLSKYYLVRDLTRPEMAAAFVAMVGIATLSWRYVERPFRSGEISRGRVVMTSAAGAAVLAAVAGVVMAQAGFPQRLSGEVAALNAAVGTNYRCPVGRYLKLDTSRACEMNLPSRAPADADFVLMGNSHAQMYAPLFEDVLVARREAGLLVPVNGCLPLTGINISPGCADRMEQLIQGVLGLKRAKVVAIGTTWNFAAVTDGSIKSGAKIDAMIGGLDRTIERLRQAGKRVVLIGPIAVPNWDVASIASRSIAFGRPLKRPLHQPEADFQKQFGRVISHFSSRPDVIFVRPDLVQCRGGRCDYLRDGASLFSDSSHLARGALALFRSLVDAAVNEAGR